MFTRHWPIIPSRAGLVLPWLLAGCTYSTPVPRVAQFPAHQSDIHLHVEVALNQLFTDQVLINGKKVGWFLIDTGANFSYLDPAAMQYLDPSAMRAADITPDAAASLQSAPHYPANSLSVGGLRVDHPLIIVKSLAAYHLKEKYRVPVVGLLGGNLWAATPFTVDYHAAEIVFHDRRSFHPPANAVAVPLHIRDGQIIGDSNKLAMWDHGCPTVRADINDVTGAEMLLDTGNSFGLVVLPFLASHNPVWLDTSRRLQAAAAVTGGEYVPFKNASLTLFGQTLDATPYASAMRGDWSASTPSDQVSTYTNGEDAMVGMEILRHFRLTFDYRAETLWAEPSPRPSLAARMARGFDINAMDLGNRTPLMEAARDADDDEFRELLHAGARPDIAPANWPLTLEIAAFGTPAMIDHLSEIHANAEWNAATAEDATPLLVSILMGNAAVAEKLLALGVDPNGSYKDLSFLQTAVSYDQPAIFHLLEKAGARPPGPQELTLLTVAAVGNAQTMLEELLADRIQRAQLEVPDASGNTPLIAAALFNHPTVARLLVQAGANRNARNTAGQSPMDIANKLGQTGIDLRQALRTP